jgi:hypothetical protein
VAQPSMSPKRRRSRARMRASCLEPHLVRRFDPDQRMTPILKMLNNLRGEATRQGYAPRAYCVFAYKRRLVKQLAHGFNDLRRANGLFNKRLFGTPYERDLSIPASVM